MRRIINPGRIAITMAILSFMTLVVLFILSCHKLDPQGPTQESALQEKMNTWLDMQKPPGKPNKSAMIDLLKENLDLAQQRKEALNKTESLLIIPIREAYKTMHKWEPGTLAELVLATNASGEIIRGKILRFSPAEGKLVNAMPPNALHNLFYSKDPGISGKFDFFSVTGRPEYGLEIKKGKLHSRSELKTKNGTAASGASDARTTCTEWYWVTRYYVNGMLVDETWEYVGTTCSSDNGCDDPDLMSLCPDGFGGGGGDNDDGCCIPDQNFQFSSSAVSQPGVDACTPAIKDPVSGLPTKTCTHQWSFSMNSLLWYHWSYFSVEIAELEKVSTGWRFKNISHGSIGKEGVVPPCVNDQVTVTSAVPFLWADKKTAKMTIGYVVNIRISCLKNVSGGSLNHSDSGYTAWYAS